MKCDYCKIQYDTADNVCPMCGMSPRKRWIKVLLRLLEGLAWIYWLSTCLMIPDGITLGNPLPVIIGSLLSLPALYYLIRKIIGRRHRVILVALRTILIVAGFILVGLFSTSDKEFSKERAENFAKEALLQRYDHDASFSYQNASVKTGKEINYNTIPVAVTFTYEIDNGYGEAVKKEATYVFYWNGLTDEFLEEHWEIRDEEQAYWESEKEQGLSVKELVHRVIYRGSAVLVLVVLIILVFRKNRPVLANPDMKWKIIGFIVLGGFLIDFLRPIVSGNTPSLLYGNVSASGVIVMGMDAALEELVKFFSVWLGTGRFKKCGEKEVLYAVTYGAAVFAILEQILKIGQQPEGTLIVLVATQLLAIPLHLVSAFVFAYFYLKGKRIPGFLLATLLHTFHNGVAFLSYTYVLDRTEDFAYFIIWLVIGICYYFIFFRIHFYPGTRINYTKKIAGEPNEEIISVTTGCDSVSDGVSDRVDKTGEKL